MAKKSKSRRGPKKELLEYFEQSFNLDRLNIVKRVQPAKDKSKLIGIAIAVAIYTIGFMLAQYGWKNNSVSYEMFIKFTWILMVPATAVGVVSWMLFYNRMENVVRQDIAGYIRQLEAEQGLIWRFIPLLSALDPNNATVKKALMSSREGHGQQIDPVDYVVSVQTIYTLIANSGSRQINTEVVDEVLQNFNQVMSE